MIVTVTQGIFKKDFEKINLCNENAEQLTYVWFNRFIWRCQGSEIWDATWRENMEGIETQEIYLKFWLQYLQENDGR
jgi:hypothetical protein